MINSQRMYAKRLLRTHCLLSRDGNPRSFVLRRHQAMASIKETAPHSLFVFFALLSSDPVFDSIVHSWLKTTVFTLFSSSCSLLLPRRYCTADVSSVFFSLSLSLARSGRSLAFFFVCRRLLAKLDSPLSARISRAKYRREREERTNGAKANSWEEKEKETHMIVRVREKREREKKRERERDERAPYGPVCLLVVSGSCGGDGGCVCVRDGKRREVTLTGIKLKKYLGI